MVLAVHSCNQFYSGGLQICPCTVGFTSLMLESRWQKGVLIFPNFRLWDLIARESPPFKLLACSKHQPNAINLWKISLLSATANGFCPPEPFKDFPRGDSGYLAGEDRAAPTPSTTNLEIRKRQAARGNLFAAQVKASIRPVWRFEVIFLRWSLNERIGHLTRVCISNVCTQISRNSAGIELNPFLPCYGPEENQPSEITPLKFLICTGRKPPLASGVFFPMQIASQVKGFSLELLYSMLTQLLSPALCGGQPCLLVMYVHNPDNACCPGNSRQVWCQVHNDEPNATARSLEWLLQLWHWTLCTLSLAHCCSSHQLVHWFNLSGQPPAVPGRLKT